MPIYHQTYRAYEGQLRRHFRWWVLVRNEWRTRIRSRLFWAIMLFPILHIAAIILFIYAIDLLTSLQDHPLGEAARNLPVNTVDGYIFFNFIRLQSFFVFLAVIMVGSGLIGNDFRYRLVDIYFSKPLTWLDYVLGKFAILVVLGFAMTFFPCILFMILHLIFAPNMANLQTMLALVWPSFAFSVALVFPCSLAVLASSAFFMSQRFAGIAVFMLTILSGVFGNALPELLPEGNENLRLLAAPVAVNRVGEAVFDRPNLIVDVPWAPAAVYVAVICVVAAAIVCLRVRKVGAAA